LSMLLAPGKMAVMRSNLMITKRYVPFAWRSAYHLKGER
jgi:hypothetical protein